MKPLREVYLLPLPLNTFRAASTSGPTIGDQLVNRRVDPQPHLRSLDLKVILRVFVDASALIYYSVGFGVDGCKRNRMRAGYLQSAHGVAIAIACVTGRLSSISRILNSLSHKLAHL